MKRLGSALLIGAVMILTPLAAKAQDIGLQVTQMPVGLKIHYEASSGEKRIATFLGKQGRTYDFAVEVFGRRGGNFTARSKYNAVGQRVRWIGDGSYREIWRPFQCYDALGSCTHKRVDQYGNGRTWVHSAKRDGNTVTALRRSKQEKRWRTPRYFTLGKYNIRMREQYRTKSGGTFWRKVTKIQEP